MKLTMIDLKMGNLQSVLEAFKRVGAEIKIITQPQDIEQANVVILPGVGAFGDGMATLRQKGLVEPVRRHAIEQKKPLLGICIGMQLLADEGEEHGLHQGLGLIPGRVIRLDPPEPRYRVPNMGWCDVTVVKKDSILFAGLPEVEAFYFAHSYHFHCSNPADVAATFEYGDCLTAVVERDNIFGVQFHPEKSQDAGLNVIEMFLKHMQQKGWA